jgi:hypothetical protein
MAHPGPQEYKTKKDKLIRINSQPFNSSARRALTGTKNINPGPGEYHIKDLVGKNINVEDIRVMTNQITN